MTTKYKVMAYEDRFHGKVKAGDILMVREHLTTPQTHWTVLAGPHTRGTVLSIAKALCSDTVEFPDEKPRAERSRGALLTPEEETEKSPEPPVKRREAAVAYEGVHMQVVAKQDASGIVRVSIGLKDQLQSMRGSPRPTILIAPLEAEDLLRVLTAYLEDQK